MILLLVNYILFERSRVQWNDDLVIHEHTNREETWMEYRTMVDNCNNDNLSYDNSSNQTMKENKKIGHLCYYWTMMIAIYHLLGLDDYRMKLT